MRVAVASDHAGFCQKSQVVNHIQSLGHEAVDLGPTTDDRVDYPDFAHKVAWGVAEGEYDRGVLICGTGLGMAMTADKVPGVRAVAIQTPGFAELCREHNDANVIVFPARFISNDEAVAMLDLFLRTPFEGGRHERRIGKMACR